LRLASAVAGLGLGVLALAGCGSGSSYKNANRPPQPINLTAEISNQGVAVSPKRFGAGPVILIVTNQTRASQEVTFETDETGGTQPGVSQSTSPINPEDTASLKVTVRPGRYVVRVKDGKIRPAHLAVGHERTSAQNELLQP
jgi:hypothetical protein